MKSVRNYRRTQRRLHGSWNRVEALTFRSFRAEDQPVVRSLVLAGLGDHWGEIDETKNPDLDDIMSSYVDRGASVVVVEREEKIVAAGTLLEEETGIGRLVRMSVAKQERGLGIGRRLVGHLVEVARSRGLHRILVETTDDWQDAIGLYRACGFLTEGFRDGDVHMYLDLN
jgi:ribosomal protein S18 acetylase RimI-like enzyme